MTHAALTLNTPSTRAIRPGSVVRLNKPAEEYPLGWSPVLDRFRGRDLTVRDVAKGATGTFVLFWELSLPARLEHVTLK